MTSSLTGATGLPRDRTPSGYKVGALNNLTSDQMNLFNQLMSGSSSGISGGLSQLSSLASGGTPEMWSQLEAPAMRQLGQLQGNIASRFGGSSMGGRRSSGFHNAQSGAAVDLAERLQGQRMGLQMGAIRDLQSLAQQLLGTKTQDRFLIKKKPSFWESLATSLGENLGAVPEAFVKSQFGE